MLIEFDGELESPIVYIGSKVVWLLAIGIFPSGSTLNYSD